MSKPASNTSDAFVMSLDNIIAVADANTAKSGSGVFKMPRKVQAFNDAVRAGVVFG